MLKNIKKQHMHVFLTIELALWITFDMGDGVFL